MRIILAALLIAITTGPAFAKFQVPVEKQAEIKALCDAEFSLGSAKATCFEKEIKAIKWLHRKNRKYGHTEAHQEVVAWCEQRTANEGAYEKKFRLKRCIRLERSRKGLPA